MKKTLLTLFMSFILILPLSTNALAAEAQKIAIDIDGKPLTMDVEPIEQNGRVLVPFRAISEGLGLEVSWDEATNTVTAIKGDKIIKLVIDSNIALINGKEVSLDVPVIILNDRTLVPIRFMAENIGSDVQWDEINLKVIIKTAVKGPVVETPVTPVVPAPTTPVTPVTSGSSGGSSGSSDSNNNQDKLDQIISKYQTKLTELRETGMNQLNSIIASAKADYKALPVEQQTQGAKGTIYLKYAGTALTLDQNIEAQVNSLLDQMKAELESNNLPTTAVEQARQEYESQKKAKNDELKKLIGL